MIDFTNTQIAFEAMSDSDLKRAKFLFEVLKSPFIVKLCKYTSQVALKLNMPIAWAVEPTLYRHFVGGKTLEECTRLTSLLMHYHVSSILDYSAEGGDSEEDIARVYQEISRSIDYAMGNRDVAYAVFKPTTLVKKATLEKYSQGMLLSEQEVLQIVGWKERFRGVCLRAYNAGVRLLVDAEDYCYQHAIDQYTEEMMRLFNLRRAIVFMTFQMYRIDRYSYLKYLYADAQKEHYIVGTKFVRGAYMEQERLAAKRNGYPDPICPTKEATDDNYNKALRYAIEHIDYFEVFAGTHNEQSNSYLADLMHDNGLANNDQRVFFAQLYGMSDNISFNLAKSGYNVAKYIPYAPIKLVLPYLIRRAEENSAVVGQTTRELSMILKEINRRVQKE